jgi:hypothetical protein
MGLLTTIAAGPRQCSHSQVRVPGDLWPYFTVSYSTSLFVASYNSQDYDGGIRPRLHTGSCPHLAQSQNQSYVMTDGQLASLVWNKAPIWGLRPDLYYCLTVTGFLMWGALSDERTGLSFAICWLDLGFLLYNVGLDLQRKRLSITYPRKRLFITQRWLVFKNLSPRIRVY